MIAIQSLQYQTGLNHTARLLGCGYCHYLLRKFFKIAILA